MGAAPPGVSVFGGRDGTFRRSKLDFETTVLEDIVGVSSFRKVPRISLRSREVPITILWEFSRQ